MKKLLTTVERYGPVGTGIGVGATVGTAVASHWHNRQNKEIENIAKLRTNFSNNTISEDEVIHYAKKVGLKFEEIIRQEDWQARSDGIKERAIQSSRIDRAFNQEKALRANFPTDHTNQILDKTFSGSGFGEVTIPKDSKVHSSNKGMKIKSLKGGGSGKNPNADLDHLNNDWPSDEEIANSAKQQGGSDQNANVDIDNLEDGWPSDEELGISAKQQDALVNQRDIDPYQSEFDVLSRARRNQRISESNSIQTQSVGIPENSGIPQSSSNYSLLQSIDSLNANTIFWGVFVTTSSFYIFLQPKIERFFQKYSKKPEDKQMQELQKGQVLLLEKQETLNQNFINFTKKFNNN